MHYDVSYKGDKDGRRAINDLIGWFGLSKSKLSIKTVKEVRDYKATHPDYDPNKMLNSISMSISFGGVSGHPVRALFEHYLGREILENWMKSPD